MINETIKGDLITLAFEGKFNLIAHGCNCFNKQKAGIAAAMVKSFQTDTFKYEQSDAGSPNKLGMIDWGLFFRKTPFSKRKAALVELHTQPRKISDLMVERELYVVNMYTQYLWATPFNPHPIDYAAVELCFKKLNLLFKGYHVGIPKIGAGLAGGDWAKIYSIIHSNTPHLNVTVVEL